LPVPRVVVTAGANQVCVPGTECEAGVCVATGLSVGLHERYCPTL
jgi:hypothetical protein